MINKSSLVKLAGPLGGYAFARWLCRSSPRILMYHRFSQAPVPGHVSVKAFEEQVAHIARYYNPVTMAELAKGLSSGGVFPANTIAITVDDGYRDFYDIAYPILRKYRVPATLYATTRFIDGEIWLWPDQMAWILSTVAELTESVEIAGKIVDAGPLEGRKGSVWWTIVQGLLSLPDAEMRQWLDDFAARCALVLPMPAPHHYRAASWDQLREMQDGGIEIGAHTVTHPSLGRVTGEQLVWEITESVRQINLQLGERSRGFCYPNGQPLDCPVAAEPIVRAAGCHSAVTAYYDKHGVEQLYQLRRYAPSEDSFQFMKSVSGVELIASRLWDANNLGGSYL